MIHNTREVEFAALSERTGSDASGTEDLEDFIEGLLLVNVTAVSGTSPTLDIIVETRAPSSTAWHKLAAMPQITSTGPASAMSLTNFGKLLRVRWEIGGTTPSFTFSIIGIFKS